MNAFVLSGGANLGAEQAGISRPLFFSFTMHIMQEVKPSIPCW